MQHLCQNDYTIQPLNNSNPPAAQPPIQPAACLPTQPPAQQNWTSMRDEGGRIQIRPEDESCLTQCMKPQNILKLNPYGI